MEREDLICELERLARTEADTKLDMIRNVIIHVVEYKELFGCDEYINRYVSMYLDNRHFINHQ